MLSFLGIDLYGVTDPTCAIQEYPVSLCYLSNSMVLFQEVQRYVPWGKWCTNGIKLWTPLASGAASTTEFLQGM